MIFSACSDKTMPIDTATEKQTATSAEKLPPDIYAPFFFKDDNISIVEFGEKCEWLDDFPYPDGKSCFTINYVDIFEFTYRYSNQIYSDGKQASNVTELKNNIHLMPFYEESFKYIKNSNQLKETYDDIVMVSDFQAENIKSGDTYIIAYALSGVEKWEGEEQIIRVGYKDVTKGYMYPIKSDHLDISDMFCELYVINMGDRNELLQDLLDANDLIIKNDPDFPIFEDGTSISDLERYFEYGSKLLYDKFWREVNNGSK